MTVCIFEIGGEKTMEAVLTNITTVFTSAMGWAGTVGTTVTSTPILLVGVVMGFVGIGVTLFRRMLNL